MTIRVENDGAVRRVTLADQGRPIALTFEVCTKLGNALEEAGNDESVRCVLLAAERRAFSVGADLKEASADPPSYFAAIVREYHRSIAAIYLMPKPVVAAVQGVAAGGGFSLALACDVRIASTAARFFLAYPKAGMAMDGGSSWRLPRLAGAAFAERMAFLEDGVSAEEAKARGLIHEVVPPERLGAVAMERAKTLAAGPTRAYGEIKRLLNPRDEVLRVLEEEAQAIARAAQTKDAASAIAAFLAKKPPAFEGR